MEVDEMTGETLQNWCNAAVDHWLDDKRHTKYNSQSLALNIFFEDDAPDPVNSPADMMAVISGLRINLTCDYEPGGRLIAHRNAWTATIGWPNLREISVHGDTLEQAVIRLFVIFILGRECGEK